MHAPRSSLLAALVVLSGCARAASVATHPVAPAQQSIVDARTVDPVSLETLAADLASVSAVYFGERHDVAADHAFERTLVAAVHAQKSSIAIGLEMFQRPAQASLDDFVAGRIDEATMLERTEYATRWGHDYAGYRPVLEFARANAIPLVALNARTEVTRAVARSGLDALAPELRAELPELDLTNAAHRALVDQALRAHPGLSEDAIARYYAAQVVWDETMGETAASYLAREPGRTLIVLAGGMHVAGGLGIPRTAERRGVTSRRIVLAIDPADLGDERERAPASRSADYFFVAEAP